MPEVKERPILFSGPMVRAILEGRKTVTRRVLAGPDHGWGFGLNEAGISFGTIGSQHPKRGKFGVFVRRELSNGCGKYERDVVVCPYGQPGERLWVRESFWQAGSYVATYPEDDTGSWSGSRRVHYRADGEPPNEPNHYYPQGLRNGSYSAADPNRIWRARPSIHMPRWASRILLEITGVRVERLHDISRSDIRAEGLECPPELASDDVSPNYRDWYPEAWRKLWESTGGDWAANPWVWVVEFKRVTP